MDLLPSLAHLVLTRIGWVFATGDSRDAEILALRHQILVLRRQVDRPKLNETDRTILALLSSTTDRTRRAATFLIVRPETVLRWHRRLVARHWTQPPTPNTGRPPIDPELRSLTIRLANDNPDWGYRRIHGELARLGHKLAASTVWKILRSAGIDRHAAEPAHCGQSSSAAGRKPSWLPASLVSTPPCSAGSTFCSSSRSAPGRRTLRGSPPTQLAPGPPKPPET
ncbi:MAG: helix-turn-helix domain-containing protein [Candidatus Microthrix sp.]|nr:helix-turn-helix domain-containing protein [Candidatus Microthrix sp.]